MGASQSSTPPRAALHPHRRGEGGTIRKFRCKISTTEPSALYPGQAAVSTYRDDLSDVERDVTTIGL